MVATNGKGTTNGADQTFETLMSWRVGGKAVSQLASPAAYEGAAEAGDEVLEIVGTTSLGNKIYFACWNSKQSTGILEVLYSDRAYDSCVASHNGQAAPKCVPQEGITLHLNGRLAQSSATTIYAGEECSFAEEFVLEGGGFGGTPEEGELPGICNMNSFHGVMYSPQPSSMLWAVHLHTGSWKLTGENEGKMCDIS